MLPSEQLQLQALGYQRYWVVHLYCATDGLLRLALPFDPEEKASSQRCEDEPDRRETQESTENAPTEPNPEQAHSETHANQTSTPDHLPCPVCSRECAYGVLPCTGYTRRPLPTWDRLMPPISRIWLAEDEAPEPEPERVRDPDEYLTIHGRRSKVEVWPPPRRTAPQMP